MVSMRLKPFSSLLVRLVDKGLSSQRPWHISPAAISTTSYSDNWLYTRAIEVRRYWMLIKAVMAVKTIVMGIGFSLVYAIKGCQGRFIAILHTASSADQANLLHAQAMQSSHHHLLSLLVEDGVFDIINRALPTVRLRVVGVALQGRTCKVTKHSLA